jgi:glucosyl-3-phosphoglycerate synthase
VTQFPSPPLPIKLATRWSSDRTYGVEQIPPLAALGMRKRDEGLRISVGIPALNEATTVGRICRIIHRELMEKAPLVDELVVLDGDSTDATAPIADEAGGRVVDVASLMPEIPVVAGKGESLWRSLSMLSGDIVVWVDADIRNFKPHMITRLVAPLIMDPTLDFVKGFYERPIEIDGVMHPSGGGRITELLARPLLALLFPELGGFLQPLAGEYAGRAEVLRRVPFFSGYSVETGLLIDLLDVIGLDGMAQVDLGRRVHRNRPLEELAPMAHSIAGTILRRAEERGRIQSAVDFPVHPLLMQDQAGRLRAKRVEEVERPPIDLTPAYIAALRQSASFLLAHG